MKKHYVKAVVELLLQGKKVDVVLANLAKTLTAKGHQSIHTQVLKAVAVELQRRSLNSKISITVADERDIKKLHTAIEASITALEGTSRESVITIDRTLIGGHTAVHNGKRIDASHKQKLIKLYQAITT